MKYVFILLAVTYIIWWILLFTFFNDNKKNEINTSIIEESIVIIIPEKELISYKNNPKWLFKEYIYSWIWTWFFTNSEWIIQTVNHIVENDNITYKILYKNKEYSSKVISRDKKNDLAKLQIITNSEILFPILKLNTNKSLTIWDELISFWVDIKNLKIISNTWILINKKSKLEDKSNLLEVSNPLKLGFSWWPVINQEWLVVWVNYAISEGKNYLISF